jgi:hypothetical protein
MCIGKAHKRVYGPGAECYGVIFGEDHIKKPNGPSFALIHNIHKADWYVSQKGWPLGIAKYALPSLTL